MNDGGWKKLSTSVVAQNPWFRIRKDIVIRPDGAEGQYNVLEQADSIHMLVRTNEDKFVFIKQYRYPTQLESWEAPAGLMEDEENILESAGRELTEETGLKAGSMRIIGTFQELAARTNAMGHVVLCEDLKQVSGADHLEEGILEQRAFDRQEVMTMIQDGRITDSGTLSTLTIALAHKLF